MLLEGLGLLTAIAFHRRQENKYRQQIVWNTEKVEYNCGRSNRILSRCIEDDDIMFSVLRFVSDAFPGNLHER